MPTSLRSTRLALGVLALALATLAAGPAAAKKTTIKMATLAPKGSAFHKVLAELGEQWKTLSGGDVQLKIYPGGVAGDDAEVVRKIRLGTLHGGLITAAGLREIDPAVHVLQLPLFYADWPEYDHVREALQPTLDQIYRDKGFVVLAWGDAGWVRFLSKAPIVTPADAAAQKLFVLQGDPKQAELWKSNGFTVVPLPATEITTALQTGLVDAVPTTAQAAVLMRWHDHAKHITGATWTPLVGGLIIDGKVWEGIEPALRDKLASAAVTAGQKLQTMNRSVDQESITEMQKRGLVVNPIPPEALAQWKAKVAAAEGRIRGDYAPAALYDQAKAIRDAYRAQNGK